MEPLKPLPKPLKKGGQRPKIVRDLGRGRVKIDDPAVAQRIGAEVGVQLIAAVPTERRGDKGKFARALKAAKAEIAIAPAKPGELNGFKREALTNSKDLKLFKVLTRNSIGPCQATWKTDPVTTGRIDPLSSWGRSR